MGYREQRRQQSLWPRLVRDWIGRQVKLRFNHRTKGGTEFKAGEILTVSTTYGSRLGLIDGTPVPNCRRITSVDMTDVELLPLKGGDA